MKDEINDLLDDLKLNNIIGDAGKKWNTELYNSEELAKVSFNDGFRACLKIFRDKENTRCQEEEKRYNEVMDLLLGREIIEPEALKIPTMFKHFFGKEDNQDKPKKQPTQKSEEEAQTQDNREIWTGSRIETPAKEFLNGIPDGQKIAKEILMYEYSKARTEKTKQECRNLKLRNDEMEKKRQTPNCSICEWKIGFEDPKDRKKPVWYQCKAQGMWDAHTDNVYNSEQCINLFKPKEVPVEDDAKTLESGHQKVRSNSRKAFQEEEPIPPAGRILSESGDKKKE